MNVSATGSAASTIAALQAQLQKDQKAFNDDLKAKADAKTLQLDQAKLALDTLRITQAQQQAAQQAAAQAAAAAAQKAQANSATDRTQSNQSISGVDSRPAVPTSPLGQNVDVYI